MSSSPSHSQRGAPPELPVERPEPHVGPALHVLWPWREWPYVIAGAAQARPKGLQARYRPVPRRLVLGAVAETVAGPASKRAAKQHSAGLPARRTCKPAPAAAKAGLRVGEAHDFPCLSPRLTYYAVAVDEVHTIVATQDADRAAGPLD